MTDAVRDAARRADWAACLSGLLAMWREVPDPSLAALIDRVSAKLRSDPVAGTFAAAEARIATATETDVPAILAYALTAMRTYPRSYELVVTLAARRGPDPRIASALAAIVEDPPFADFKRHGKGGLQRDVVEALHRTGDPRFRTVLHDAWKRVAIRAPRKHQAARDALGKIVREIVAGGPTPKLENAGKLVKDIDVELARTTPAQRERATSEAELLVAILDNPHDIGLRQVYADVLQEAGDPRGEFIALQCGRAGDAPPSKRERELVKAYGRTWLGDIEPIIRKQGVVYRRGFVACVREGLKYTKHAPLFASPAWGTVEALELDIWNDTATKFLCDPRWKALRKVYGLYHATFESLRGKTLPWTALGLRHARPENWALAVDVLPEVVELDISQNLLREHLPAIAKTTLVDRVRAIRATYAGRQDAELVGVIPPTITLELVGGYSFPGDPDGESVQITGTRAALVHHGTKLDLRFAMRVLAAVPRLTAIELRAPVKARVDDARWADLTKVLARHDLTLARPS